MKSFESDSLNSLTPQEKEELSALLISQRPQPTDTFYAAGMTPDLWQKKVLLSKAQRILLLCSRQSGKSTVTACLACHEAIHKPGSLVLLLSPSLRQSSELFRKVLSFFQKLHAAPSPDNISALRLELSNGSRVVSLPSSEETIRGFSGANLLILDEASRVPDPLYLSCRPMLAVSHGRLIALSTPWSKTGWFHTAWNSEEQWEKYLVTALDCPRITPEFLEEEKRVLGTIWFNTEYMCQFADSEGSVFSSESIQNALTNDVKPLFGV